jgi:biofilm protein TabA
MIIDCLENMPMYFTINKSLRKVYRFLKGIDAAHCAYGRHILDEDGMYANIEKYTTQAEEGRKAEAHKCYIDVQFLLIGEERIGYAPLVRLKERGQFDTENDIGFYEGECQTWINMQAGTFAVILPHEGHLPGIMLKQPSEVIKVVVKIPVERWEQI